MGADEEPNIPELPMLKSKRTAPYPEAKLHPWKNLLHHRTVFLLIVVLFLVTTTLAIALIVVTTTGSQSCNRNSEERKETTTSILLAVTDTIEVQLPDPCQEDWVWYRRKCYYFSEEDKTWADSLQFCKLRNASLVIVESREELKFLFRSKGSEANHWIGLKSTDDNTGWIWVNGALYNGDIFPKPKFSSKTQYVYLNKKNINSYAEIFENHWICSKPAFSDT